ncbi:sialidase family protein, partial [Planctomycetota bacterium]
RRPRDWRTSPLVAQPPLPLLAVARATVDGADAVLAVFRDPDGKSSSLKLLAKAPGLSGDPVVFQACSGTVACMFPVTSDGACTTMAATSHDGGATWTQPARITVEGHSGGFRITSPPVEEADGSWLVSALVDADGGQPRLGIFESADEGATWRLAAECPPLPDDPKRLADPSLAVARDGPWAVAARQVEADGEGREITVIVSADRGKSWTRPRPIGLEGICPEIVELLEGLFLVVAEDDTKSLQTAFSWDELEHFIARPLACGYCLRLGGQKHLARGSGVDLAGRYHDLAQAPPEDDEIEAARARAKVRIPASDEAFRFKGAWERVERETGDVACTSIDSAASVELGFHGSVVFLIHNTSDDGRLVGVKIDGQEHPPVDMKGSERVDVKTCLATDLAPGPHKLTLWPLLRWRTGAMTIRGVDVASNRE